MFVYECSSRERAGPAHAKRGTAPGLARLAGMLICSTMFVYCGASAISPAHAQQGGQAAAQGTPVSMSIPAQSLGSAMDAFSRATGWQVGYSSAIDANLRTAAVSGTMTPRQALQRMLAGTGVGIRITGPRSAALVDPNAGGDDGVVSTDGSLVLDPIDITAGGGRAVYSPYETAAPTDHISGERIERFRGTNPADMFRGTPGVMSGEARNGAGSIDPNIRGMQGLGRVNVTVDGAENQVTVHQGYQGISSRTFVDPDFVAGIDVTKGSDAASSGIAGTVAIRTVDAADIVKDGKRFGFHLKGGFGTNTSTSVAGNEAGYEISNPLGTTNNPNSGFGSAVPSATGMDRPSFLDPTQGSASVIGAASLESFDLLFGYAYRERGNYHAGTNGPHANPVGTGERPFCYSSGYCPPMFIHRDYVENKGLVNYRPGEEVLNSRLRTESLLAKGTLRFSEAHSLKLTYNGYRSEAGDVLASRLTSNATQDVQQAQTTGIELNTGTARYLWQPHDNDLFDFEANLWVTDLQQRRPIRFRDWQNPPSRFGLPNDFRVGSDTFMWGGDVSNTSRLETSFGALDLEYGLSFKDHDIAPSHYQCELEWACLRDGERREAAAFGKLSWQPLDWLTVNGGLRYQHYWSQDRSKRPRQLNPGETENFIRGQSLDQGGLSPSLGVTLEPVDGTQFYVNYSDATRLPGIMETIVGFSATGFDAGINNDLKPERSKNWEIGANLFMDDVFAAGDVGMIKLGYFNWHIEDYIAREWSPVTVGGFDTFLMRLYNLDSAKFSGLEVSSRYEIGGFAAELSANYYLNVEFCRTADTCQKGSIYADYATNQVPPEYTVGLTLSQKFMDEALTIGGRVTHVGPRAAGHGDVTGRGLGEFINLVEWETHTLVDVFAEYKLTDDFTLTARVENLFDEFYVDPLSLVTQPGPGRTFYASLKAEF